MTANSQKTEVVTLVIPSQVSNGNAEPRAPPVITIPDMSVATQYPVRRNLEKEFTSQCSIPIPSMQGLAMGLPNVSLFTESAKVNTVKWKEVLPQDQFRLTPHNTNVAVQARTWDFLEIVDILHLSQLHYTHHHIHIIQ